MSASTEQRVLDAIEAGRDELVALVGELVAFDTTARDDGRSAAGRGRSAGAPRRAAAARRRRGHIGSRRPGASRVAPIAPGLDFAGRPQLAATFAGAGGGRSLLLNGHIDVVTPEPDDRWRATLRAEVRDGNSYGRGACDMKGGVAAMVFAAETLARLGIRSAATWSSARTPTRSRPARAGRLRRHGVRADAGIYTEPTRLEVWRACRGRSP